MTAVQWCPQERFWDHNAKVNCLKLVVLPRWVPYPDISPSFQPCLCSFPGSGIPLYSFPGSVKLRPSFQPRGLPNIGASSTPCQSGPSLHVEAMVRPVGPLMNGQASLRKLHMPCKCSSLPKVLCMQSQFIHPPRGCSVTSSAGCACPLIALMALALKPSSGPSALACGIGII